MTQIGQRGFTESKKALAIAGTEDGPAQAAKLASITKIEPCDLLNENFGGSMKDASPQVVMAGDYPEFEPNPVRADLMDVGLTEDLAHRLRRVPTDGNNMEP